MLKTGSLKAAMSERAQSNAKMIAVVIDQQFVPSNNNNLITAQAEILNHARQLGAPVWTVFPLPGSKMKPMVEALGQPDQSFCKKGFSVFAPETTPSFAAAMSSHPARYIVVMGHAVGQCVKLAAYGGYEDSARTQWIDGISRRLWPQRIVMTCPQILSGAEDKGPLDATSWLWTDRGTYCYPEV